MLTLPDSGHYAKYSTDHHCRVPDAAANAWKEHYNKWHRNIPLHLLGLGDQVSVHTLQTNHHLIRKILTFTTAVHAWLI